MRKTLNSIATIRSGYTFREKILELTTGGARVLQIKDLRRQHTELCRSELQAELLPCIHWDGSPNALLSPNSVVLPARGEYYKASIYTGSAKIVASSQLLIITIKDKRVLPAWLCWVLNQNTAQHDLENASRGTSISLLSSQSVGRLALHIPPLPTQHKIVALQQLWEQEQQLTKALLSNRERMLTGMFQQLMTSDSKNTANGDKT